LDKKSDFYIGKYRGGDRLAGFVFCTEARLDMESGHVQNAAVKFQKSLECYENIGDDSERLSILKILLELYIKSGNYRKAETILKTIKSELQNNASPDETAELLYFQSRLSQFKTPRNTDQRLKKLQKAQKILRKY